MRDAKAIRTVVGVLRKHDGHVTKAAEELGVGLRTMHMWASEVPEIAAESRGREWTRPSEKEIAKVVATLVKHEGKITYTAEALGISVHTLYRLIDEVPEIAKHAGGTGNRRSRRGRAA